MSSTEIDESVVLKTEGLTKYYGEVHAVDGISLTVRQRELVSIIGPNGSGKTTLLNLISGLIEPDSGKVFFNGRDVTGNSPDKLTDMGLLKSFQIANLFEGLTVLDNIRVATSRRLRRTNKIFSKINNDEEVRKNSFDVLGLFGLQKVSDMFPPQLSYGNRKLLDIAICFALRPKIVLLDEPTSGVSTWRKNEIMGKITNAVRVGAVTAVIVEHDMDLVFSYSDRVIALNRGQILAEGKPEEVRANPEVRRTVTGEC